MVRTLTLLGDIPLPSVAAEERYSTSCRDRTFTFTGLKALLGAADCSKAGDRNAGLAARDEREREDHEDAESSHEGDTSCFGGHRAYPPVHHT